MIQQVNKRENVMRQIVIFFKSTATALLALAGAGLLATVALNLVYRPDRHEGIGFVAVAISFRSPIVWAVVTIALAAAYWEYRRASGR